MSHSDPMVLADNTYQFGSKRFTHTALYFVLEELAEQGVTEAVDRFDMHARYLRKTLPDYIYFTTLTRVAHTIQLPLVELYGPPNRGIFAQEEIEEGAAAFANEYGLSSREQRAYREFVREMNEGSLTPAAVVDSHDRLVMFAQRFEQRANLLSERAAVLNVLKALREWSQQSDERVGRLHQGGAFARVLTEFEHEPDAEYLENIFAGLSRTPGWLSMVENPAERNDVDMFRLYPSEEYPDYGQGDWFDNTLADYINDAFKGSTRQFGDVLVALDPAMDFDVRPYIDRLPGDRADSTGGGGFGR